MALRLARLVDPHGHTLMRMDWTRVPTTRNWVLVDDSRQAVRHIAVRERYIGETDGTRYVVTGRGHEMSTHFSMDEARAAAEASLKV
ncbi:MAG: hypothetical protein JWM85_3492 [Acidimicrobiaceae bacterium]|nr:hypothetical protein [Acidimicrobiaceae bacterium]